MKLERFTIGALPRLDGGKVGAAIQQAIKTAVADIADRTTDDRARKVVVTIALEPTSLDERHDLETVGMVFDIKVVLPARSSMAYSFKAGANQDLLFAAESPEDVNQQVIEGFRESQKGIDE